MAESGGFLPSPRSIQAITSPAPSHSSLSSSTTSSLPHPRRTPLKAGSAKEDAARRYVEGRMLGISRRYVKKFQALDELEDANGKDVVRGYMSFKDVAADLSEVVDVIWLSGTPSLQIPYLLNVALAAQSYLPAFHFAPNATFSLLRRLDHAFASLIKGQDIDTEETLPGFFEDGRGGLSRTDMVRCKGIVEGTRVVVVEVATRENEEDEVEDGEDESEQEKMEVDEEDDSDDDDFDGPVGRPEDQKKERRVEEKANRNGESRSTYDVDHVEGENDMDVAKVYEKTIIALGEALGAEAGAFGLGSGS